MLASFAGRVTQLTVRCALEQLVMGDFLRATLAFAADRLDRGQLLPAMAMQVGAASG